MDNDTRAILQRLVKTMEDLTRQVMSQNEQILRLELRVALMEGDQPAEDE